MSSRRRLISLSLAPGLLLLVVARPASVQARPEPKITAVSVTQDGSLVVSASADRTLTVWKAERTDRPISFLPRFTLRGHLGAIIQLACSGDGTIISSASTDGTARLWKADTGALLGVLSVTSSAVTTVALSHDGQLAATGIGELWRGAITGGDPNDGVVQVWTVATGAARRTIHAHRGDVTSVAFLASGTQVISGGRDGAVRVWDVATGAMRREFEHHQSVERIFLSEDEQYLLVEGRHPALRIWNLLSGASEGSLEGPHRLHSGFVGPRRVLTFSWEDGPLEIRLATKLVSVASIDRDSLTSGGGATHIVAGASCARGVVAVALEDGTVHMVSLLPD